MGVEAVIHKGFLLLNRRRLSASFGGLRETSYLFGSLPRRWSAESAKCMIESLDLAHTTPAATGEVA